jgi:hypothetical protein
MSIPTCKLVVLCGCKADLRYWYGQKQSDTLNVHGYAPHCDYCLQGQKANDDTKYLCEKCTDAPKAYVHFYCQDCRDPIFCTVCTGGIILKKINEKNCEDCEESQLCKKCIIEFEEKKKTIKEKKCVVPICCQQCKKWF